MVKSQRKTRRVSGSRTNKKSILTIPQLRKAFDHMDKVVENLRKVAKHSFSDAVITYREEWRKTFKRDLSPADASAYLKFRYGMKSKHTRRSRTRGGALGMAPLEYQMRPGETGVYGHFPSYQQAGLDRSYGSAMSASCGKQTGGSWSDALFRPVMATAPPGVAYTGMMVNMKGTTPYPTSDPVGPNVVSRQPNLYLQPNTLSGYDSTSSLRTFPADVYKTTGASASLWPTS